MTSTLMLALRARNACDIQRRYPGKQLARVYHYHREIQNARGTAVASPTH